MKGRITITIDKNLLKRLDRERVTKKGIINRSTFIENILEKVSSNEFNRST